jgi:hypothetical protein
VLLSSVTFTNETSSGWQEQNLTTPLTIAPNTMYVVSVNVNSNSVAKHGGLASTITNGPLSTIADAVNGVYHPTIGSFPTAVFNNTNYFTDIVLIDNSAPTPAPTSTPGSPAPEQIFYQQSPSSLNQNDSQSYELGMKFQSVTTGQIQAIRFWKDSNETGAHVGRIWSAGGALLASVNFTGESASGWQQQALGTPLNISANTTYVVSVNCNAQYVSSSFGLKYSNNANGNLSTVADGSNGIYSLTPGSFPTLTFNQANYFRDIVFLRDP